MSRDFTVDLYWSFRSPYSYLALPRIVTLSQRPDVKWNLRIVYPLAIRYPDYFKRQHPLAMRYILADCERVATFLGMPYRWPSPDPVVQNMATREISPDQPHIDQLTRLGIAANRQGKGIPFIAEVSRLLWDGRVTGWNEGTHLACAAERAGLNLVDLERAIEADPAGMTAEIDANQAAQYEAGHWGVPLFVFDGEPFFGQDRLDLLVWRMQQKGLPAIS